LRNKTVGYLPNISLYPYHSSNLVETTKIKKKIGFIISTFTDLFHLPCRRIHRQLRVEFKSTVFWDMTPCSLVGVYRRFGGNIPPLSLKVSQSPAGSLFTVLLVCSLLVSWLEDGGSEFLRYVGDLPEYISSHPIR
jgi:hypothetical protein